MFKRLVSTVFACALLVNGAVSAQTVDAQALALALSNATPAELTELAQNAKEAVAAKARAEGMTEEQVAVVVAKIENNIASLGSASGSTTKKEAKLAWILVGASLTVGGYLVYKFVLPKVAGLFKSTDADAKDAKDAKKSKKDAKAEEKEEATGEDDKDGDKAEKEVKKVADHKGHAHAAKDKAPAKGKGKEAKAPVKGKKATEKDEEVAGDESEDDEDGAVDEDEEEDKEEAPKAKGKKPAKPAAAPKGKAKGKKRA